MKISDIITESEFDPYAPYDLASPEHKDIRPIESLADLVPVIKQNCSEILKCYQQSGEVLYRGIKGAISQTVITGIRDSRKPLQMDAPLHNFLTKVYTHMGIRAHRGNSIFCTTSRGTAMDWGRAYIVFPKDGWVGSWAAALPDDYAFYTCQNIARFWLYRSMPAKDKLNGASEMVRTELDVQSFDHSTLGGILRKRPIDLLITGDSYIGVYPTSAPEFTEFLAALGLRK